MSLVQRLACSTAPRSVLIVRILVGWVFLSEGIQKFLFPAILGVGRFAKIGIPAPDVLAPFVGGLEIVCGTLVLLGLLTRPAALFLLLNITVALLSTKLPILLGHGYWRFNLPNVSRYGLWGAASEARTDMSMFLGSLFLIVAGAGAWSLDALLGRPKAPTS